MLGTRAKFGIMGVVFWAPKKEQLKKSLTPTLTALAIPLGCMLHSCTATIAPITQPNRPDCRPDCTQRKLGATSLVVKPMETSATAKQQNTCTMSSVHHLQLPLRCATVLHLLWGGMQEWEGAAYVDRGSVEQCVSKCTISAQRPHNRIASRDGKQGKLGLTTQWICRGHIQNMPTRSVLARLGNFCNFRFDVWKYGHIMVMVSRCWRLASTGA